MFKTSGKGTGYGLSMGGSALPSNQSKPSNNVKLGKAPGGKVGGPGKGGK